MALMVALEMMTFTGSLVMAMSAVLMALATVRY
jgi:hypothetical protein